MMSKGSFKPVPLKQVGDSWKLDIEAFKSLITPKTRCLLLNTPHNPTGKVFSREELEEISEVLKAHP